MSGGETRDIKLTGDAARASRYGSRKRKSRKNSEGGGSGQGGTIVQLQASSSPTTIATDVQGVNPSKLAEVAASTQNGGNQKTQETQETQENQKVVLKAAKKKEQKVVLAVSKVPSVNVTNISNKNKSRKSSKKITLSLNNLRKKLKVAKTIKHSAKEKSLEEIKKVLEEAKLIKSGSKAPEAMIRQMYADYQSLNKGAL